MLAEVEPGEHGLHPVEEQCRRHQRPAQSRAAAPGAVGGLRRVLPGRLHGVQPQGQRLSLGPAPRHCWWLQWQVVPVRGAVLRVA